MFRRVTNFIISRIAKFLPNGLREKYKGNAEIAYWRRLSGGPRFTNHHFCWFYTELFGLTSNYYEGKRLLDIGCGPLGSLEWATMVSQRVGLDPLVDRYRSLGIEQHAMEYCQARAEKIPYGDGHFDMITSFNSLDHVDNLESALREIYRILRPGGRFLLITEVNHAARPTEPVEICERELKLALSQKYSILSWRAYLITKAHDLYKSVKEGEPLAELPSNTPGLIVAAMNKPYLNSGETSQ